MLKLTQAFTTYETQDSSDYPTVTLSRDGQMALSYYKSTTGYATKVPANVYTISPVKCGEILSPCLVYTGASMTASNRFIIAVVGSPSLDKILVASVYQNYTNPSDPLNAFSSNDAVNGTTHDIRLDLLDGKLGVVSSVVIKSVYLSPLIFSLFWPTKRQIAVMYPTGASSSSFTIEVRRGTGLGVMASTSSYPIYSTNLVIVKLCERHYVFGSGAAIDSNGNSVTPSGVYVSEIDSCGKVIETVASYEIGSVSQWFDVKVTGKEALIVNGTSPVVKYYIQYVDGVTRDLYNTGDDSSVQLLRFCGYRLTLVDALVLNLSSDYALSFVPCSNKLIVTTQSQFGTNYGQTMVYELGEEGFCLKEAKHVIAHRSRLSFAKNGRMMVASGVTSTKGPNATGINSVQMFSVRA